MKFDFLTKNEKDFFINKASTLVEALPYIREHRGKIIVIMRYPTTLFLRSCRVYPSGVRTGELNCELSASFFCRSFVVATVGR